MTDSLPLRKGSASLSGPAFLIHLSPPAQALLVNRALRGQLSISCVETLQSSFSTVRTLWTLICRIQDCRSMGAELDTTSATFCGLPARAALAGLHASGKPGMP